MTQNNICVLHEEQSIALGDWPFDEHMTGTPDLLQAIHMHVIIRILPFAPVYGSSSFLIFN